MNTTKKEKPTPLPPFASVEEAVELLKSFHFAPDMNKGTSADKLGIVESSGRGNVFRAFKNVPKPSGIYRNWAAKHYGSIHEQLKLVQSQQQFDNVLLTFSEDLIKSWNKECGGKNLRIGYGPATKLMNLLVKTIQRHPMEQIKGLEKFMHVPFDLYTILPLRKIINDLTDIDYKIPIPNNPTMQFVINKDLYLLLQGAVRKIALQAERHPILYDYLCWDSQH